MATDFDRVDFYLGAAHRPNTQRSYESALQHFEVTWGGLLPATGDSVARYLADHEALLAAQQAVQLGLAREVQLRDQLERTRHLHSESRGRRNAQIKGRKGTGDSGSGETER